MKKKMMAAMMAVTMTVSSMSIPSLAAGNSNRVQYNNTIRQETQSAVNAKMKKLLDGFENDILELVDYLYSDKELNFWDTMAVAALVIDLGMSWDEINDLDTRNMNETDKAYLNSFYSDLTTIAVALGIDTITELF